MFKTRTLADCRSKRAYQLFVIGICLFSSACDSLDNCPAAQEKRIINTGRTDKDALTFDSVPGGERLDAFPAKTIVRFEHGLEQVPLLPQILLAFGPEGTNGAGGGSVAIAAGNEALITCMDAHVIEVKNDTCESGFFIRVITSGVDPDGDADACGP